MAFTNTLCDVCEKLTTQNKDRLPPTVSHHSSIPDLVKAASLGCQLCRLLWNTFSVNEKLTVELRGLESSPYGSYQISCHLEKEPNSQNDICCIFEFPMRESGLKVKKNLKFRYSKEPPDYLPFERDPSTEPTTSLEWAKGWINKCSQEHSICAEEPNSARKLPNRLVWVGLSEADHLRLCHTQSLPPDTKYVTLSHRWGSRKILTLTTMEIGRFREQIPYSELPKTFQDAIAITRFMAIRYIWIDSLCIVQDSDSDWETESLLMKDVYSNGYFNIAALHGADDEETQGFMGRDESSNSFTIEIPRQSCKGHSWFSPGRYVCTYECPDGKLWEMEVTNSNLLRRAWVFQERLLSPRVLHFASSRVFFECKKSRACDLFLDKDIEIDYRQVGWQLHDNFKTRIHHLLTVASNLLPNERKSGGFLRADIARSVWMWMVKAYSACQLTRESDRLVAIAGLAYHIQPLLSCRYLAGLWEDGLVEQLLWYKDGESRPTETYQAPSWSWASKIGMTSLYGHNMADLAGAAPIYHDQGEIAQDIIKVCEAEVTTIEDNPFGQVTDGRLRLKGILIPITLDPIKLLIPSDPIGPHQNRRFKARGIEFEVLYDFSGEMPIGRYSCAMCLRTTSFLNGIYEDVTGLLLKATGKEKGQYERVGLLRTSSGKDSIDPLVTAFGGDQAEKAMITDELYEEYDEATREYTFTIV